MLFSTSSRTITANNGLNKIGGNIRLGGLLTGNTDIALTSNNFSLTKNSSQLLFQKTNAFPFERGFNSAVQIIGVQPSDGKIIIGGQFTAYNGVAINRIARLNSSDGTMDTSFNVGNGFNQIVNAIAVQTDGKIILGGDFTTYDDSSINRIIRLNTDGTIDTSFNVGSAFNSTVSAIVIQSDGKIIIGGAFSTFSGTTQNKLIRLNSNGSKDSTYNIGTGFVGNVNTLALQPDGKVVAGGTFTTFTGTTVNRIVRLNTNGSRDTSFNGGTAFNSSVNTIAVQSGDIKIVVGGLFTTYKGVSVTKIVRLNT